MNVIDVGTRITGRFGEVPLSKHAPWLTRAPLTKGLVVTRSLVHPSTLRLSADGDEDERTLCDVHDALPSSNPCIGREHTGVIGSQCDHRCARCRGEVCPEFEQFETRWPACGITGFRHGSQNDRHRSATVPETLPPLRQRPRCETVHDRLTSQVRECILLRRHGRFDERVADEKYTTRTVTIVPRFDSREVVRGESTSSLFGRSESSITAAIG